MVKQLCVCDLVPALATSSSLTLLLHPEEAQKPTNSGRLAARCLRNASVVVGDLSAAAGEPRDDFVVTPRSVLLFPAAGARTLTAADGPVDLVVVDGTWKQAKKMRGRSPALQALPAVTLPTTTTTTWRLRNETREHGLSTFEAIAVALGIVEGDDVRDALLALFRTWVDRTLWLRGVLRDHEVSGGIPEAARLHDPRGGAPKAP